jgi:hypothetical protein
MLFEMAKRRREADPLNRPETEDDAAALGAMRVSRWRHQSQALMAQSLASSKPQSDTPEQSASSSDGKANTPK